jgi:hypothetical protein
VGLELVLSLKQLRGLRFTRRQRPSGQETARPAAMANMRMGDQRHRQMEIPAVTPEWLERTRSLSKLERLPLQGRNRISDSDSQTLAAMPDSGKPNPRITGITKGDG